MLKVSKNYYGIPSNYSSITEYIDFLKKMASNLNTNVPKNTVKAILVPHAGLTYSGLGACQGYLSVNPARFNTIVILSTFHNSSQYSQGLYLPDFSKFGTPLGMISNDVRSIKKIINSDSYCHYGTQDMFDQEHSLIHQLPFIQNIYGNDKKLVPILCGNIGGKITKDDYLIKYYLKKMC